VRVVDRAAVDRATWSARAAAFPAGEFVGQESPVQASEVLALARRAGVGPGVAVLDLCCGVAGPGRLVAAELGCDYRGVDEDAGAVALAQEAAAAAGLACRFEVARVPPLPPGPVEVVLLLETLLAFRDKAALLHAVTSALPVGGRFAFTVEEGSPLTVAEAAAMPAADTVWPVPLLELLAGLRLSGLAVRWVEDRTSAHLEVFRALRQAYAAERTALVEQLGDEPVADLLASHDLWCTWLRERRVRKLAVVAERVAQPS
jgi:hypothetical protein